MKTLISIGLLGIVAILSCTHKPEKQDRKPTSDGAEQIEQAQFTAPAGQFYSHVSWTVDPFPPSNDVLRSLVEFIPNTKKNNLCPSIRFIQIARVEKTDGVDYQWDSFEKNRNSLRTVKAAGVTPGYFVDHLSDKCEKGKSCSPYFRDHWANADESQDGYKKSSGDLKKASLIDYPFGWTEFERISAESCAFCEHEKKYYGCVKWSALWPLMGSRVISVPTFAGQPSKTFAQALNNFSKFYSPAKKLKQ